MAVLRSFLAVIVLVTLDLFGRSYGGVITLNTTQTDQKIRTAPRKLNALWELGSMIKCTTGKDLFRAIFDYAWYGCYCGFGGKGVPVDGTDRCCMIHDNCYDVAFKSHDCPFQPEVYYILYRRHFHMRNCLTPQANITCDAASAYPSWFRLSHCAASICKCDAAVSMCIGRNPFDRSHAFYPKRTCRKGRAPTISPVVENEVTTW